MLRTVTLLLAGFVLAATPPQVRAQDDDSRALVLKAMQAHGGKKNLNKYPAAQIKLKGEVEVMGVQAKFTGEMFFLLPDKMKNIMTVEVNNMNLDIIQVFDGKQFHMKVAGQAIELKDDDLIKETKASLYCEKVASLMDLDDPAYKLSSLGEVQVSNKPAVGIRVSREGQRDVNLFFDKQSHLLVKYEFRAKDFMGQMEVTQEKLVSDYKEVMGVQTATKMTMLHDGKKAMDLEVIETRFAETFDDSYFTKP
jgi:hypothetical protein